MNATILFTLVVHLSAMLSMLALLPGMPGGISLKVLDRAAYLANHPWVWRVGWFPWQLTAVSDLLLGIALVRTRWIAKPAAVLTLIATVAAVIPDQTGQTLWMWSGPRLAAQAVRCGDFSAYRQFEVHVFRLIAACASVGYITAALGWTWCFAGAGVWSTKLTWVSWLVWPTFVFATASLALATPYAVLIASVANAVAFVLLIIWLAMVTQLLLRRSFTAADRETARF